MKTIFLSLAITLCSLGINSQVLIPFGSSSTWKYFDQGTQPSATWQTTAYGDGSWSSGPAPLGYNTGNTGINQVVSYGSDANNKFITTYFRKAVNISQVSNLRVKMTVDDGAIVYFNGVEVFRANMTAANVNNSTYALTPILPNNGNYEFFISKEFVQSGNNVFAVEIHQATAASSDILFDLELSVNNQTAVNNNYAFYAPANMNTGSFNYIEWGTNFSLPSRFVTSWEYVHSHSNNNANPISHGFSHTQSLYGTNTSQIPIANRTRQYGALSCWGGGNEMSNSFYSELPIKRQNYDYVYKTGSTIPWNNSQCTNAPANVPFATSPIADYPPAYWSNNGVIEPNIDLVAVDFETYNGLLSFYGTGGFDAWLECLRTNNTTTNNCQYQTYPNNAFYPLSLNAFTSLPNNFASMSPWEFKKLFLRRTIRDMNNPLIAYKALSPNNHAKIINWPSSIIAYSEIAANSSASWQTITTDLNYIDNLFKDTINFTQLGNSYLDNLYAITPAIYVSNGNEDNYNATSGYWLQNLLMEIETTKKWLPNKPILPYLWLKNDGYYNENDSIFPGDPLYNTPKYFSWKDKHSTEGMAVFCLMTKGDGFIMWDGDNGTTNNRIYDYFLKGMRRVSHFSSLVANPTDYYSNFDPIQIRNMQTQGEATNTYNFGIARALITGDSILIAAQNPNAARYQVTRIPIHYTGNGYNYYDTISVTGREIFLGAAKMGNAPVVSTCDSAEYTNIQRSTCNGTTTFHVSQMNGSLQVEYSIDNQTTWGISNYGTNGFTWSFPETTNCVSLYAREIGCTSPVTFACWTGSAPCSSVSILELTNENIRLYPNPVNDQLHIGSDFPLQDAIIKLADLKGNVLFTTEYSNEMIINTSELSEGIYIIKIITKDNTYAKRFVKN